MYYWYPFLTSCKYLAASKQVEFGGSRVVGV
nr:MAG TPA: hypothetical protein [Crassvirales sp.]